MGKRENCERWNVGLRGKMGGDAVWDGPLEEKRKINEKSPLSETSWWETGLASFSEQMENQTRGRRSKKSQGG